MGLHEKTALVTGAAKGLGKAFSRILLQQGAQVCLADVNTEVGQKTLKEFQNEFGMNRVAFIKCDVTKEEDVKNLFEKAKVHFGSLDILINNAGVMNENKWESMLDINLVSLVRMTQAGIEAMGKHNKENGGVIVNIASAAGIMPSVFAPVYSASKFGVVGFTRCFKYHPKRKDYMVRVNCLCPAFADTDILKVSEEDGQFIGKDIAQKFINYAGVMKPETVAENMLPLILDTSLNGDVLVVTTFGSKMLNYKENSLEDLLKSSL